ncbi:MAG TPA: PKD domain-containing protein [Candidatus Limnocylindrales bacterium]|nr:PKD domain-containing protein [Candidatus Limnocylindrales bacterium]
MKINQVRKLWYSTVLPILVAAGRTAEGCGNDAATITNLPPAQLGGYQVYALNPSGQLTGFFYNSSHGAHAFIYSAGAITDLGTLGGNVSIGYAMNSAGTVVGQADLASGTHAFLYNGGVLNDLKTLGGSYSSAAAINDAGQVVGESYTTNDVGPIAFLYATGPMVSLGTLGSNYSSAFALNNAGIVVGESGLSNGDIHGFVYAGGSMSDLTTLGGNYSSAFAVNDAGLIVGESSVANGDTHAFVYSGGSMTDLGTFGGSYSSAFVVNTNSQVAGVANTTNDEQTRGFLYDHGTRTDLGTLGGGYSSVWALNNLGQVVGNSALANGTQHAFLWRNGSMVDLNSLLPANSGWELLSAQFINDAGRIVGFGLYGGSSQWFVMDLGGGNSSPVAVAGPNQTVDCQAQVTLNGSGSSDPGNGPLTFEWSMGGAVLGNDAVLTTSLPLGTNVVTLTVTDVCGASNQANVVVTVVDTTPPTGSCPSDMTTSSDANCQAAVPDVVSQVVANDNCTPRSGLTITQDPVAGTLVGLGSHPISINVTDSSGNSSSCSVSFTVLDKTAPTIVSVPAPLTVSAGLNCQATVPNVLGGVVATDTCTAANQLNLSQNPAAGAPVGTGPHTIVVTAMDASGNSSTANISLNVVDTTAPSFVSVPGPMTISAGAHCQGVVPNVLANVVASDNCTAANQLGLSQNPAAGSLLGTGQYMIVITAMDASGNSSTANVALEIADTTAPSFVSVPGPITVSADANCQGVVPSVLANVVASDNCTLANQISLSQSPAAGTLLGTGQYTIVVTAMDASGNSSSANVALTVANTNPPVIQSLSASPNSLIPPNHQMVAVTVTAVIANNCGCAPITKIISVTSNESLSPGEVQITGNLTLNLAASRDPSGNGRVYTITVQSTDASGNVATGTVLVTVPKGNGNGSSSTLLLKKK